MCLGGFEKILENARRLTALARFYYRFPAPTFSSNAWWLFYSTFLTFLIISIKNLTHFQLEPFYYHKPKSNLFASEAIKKISIGCEVILHLFSFIFFPPCCREMSILCHWRISSVWSHVLRTFFQQYVSPPPRLCHIPCIFEPLLSFLLARFSSKLPYPKQILSLRTAFLYKLHCVSFS